MAITHSKVSGLTNPIDPDIIGGEDWDDDHVVTGPRVLDCFAVFITTAGAILSQYADGLTFSKTGTGTYRAEVPAGYLTPQPIIFGSVSIPSGTPRFLRAQIVEDTSVWYAELTVTDSTGAAVDVSAGSVSGIICTAG